MEINKHHFPNYSLIKASKLIAYLFVVASFNAGAFFISDVENNDEDNKQSKTKIEYYLANPNARDQIAKQGHSEAVNFHSYKHRAKEFLKLFHKFELDKTLPAFNVQQLKILSILENLKNKMRVKMKFSRF